MRQYFLWWPQSPSNKFRGSQTCLGKTQCFLLVKNKTAKMKICNLGKQGGVGLYWIFLEHFKSFKKYIHITEYKRGLIKLGIFFIFFIFFFKYSTINFPVIHQKLPVQNYPTKSTGGAILGHFLFFLNIKNTNQKYIQESSNYIWNDFFLQYLLIYIVKIVVSHNCPTNFFVNFFFFIISNSQKILYIDKEHIPKMSAT